MNFLPEKIDDYSVSHSQKEPQILQELILSLTVLA